MTDKLYYINAYDRKFTGKVLSCEKNKSTYEIILDRTLFYPEGGGQLADIGDIYTSDNNKIKVIDTQEKNGVIIHYCDNPVEVGSNITGEINWDYRFDLMQNHSGEHMLSGIICSKYGYNNVGFHMGKDKITLDFDGKVPENDLELLEIEVNKGIWENVDININTYIGKELKAVDYRSKKELEGEVRIVRSGKYDCCACCGTHVAKAGEIGIIKIVGCQNYKGGSRLEILCGSRCLNYLQMCVTTVKKIGNSLSVPENKVYNSFEKLSEENSNLNQKVNELKLEVLRSKVITLIESLDKGNKIHLLTDGDLKGKDLNIFSELVLESYFNAYKKSTTIFILGESKKENEYSFLINSNDSGFDVASFFKELKMNFDCKGGGKNSLVQGSINCDLDELKLFLEKK